MPEMDELDINARYRLAFSRIKMEDIKEGRVWLPHLHSNPLLTIIQDARRLRLA